MIQLPWDSRSRVAVERDLVDLLAFDAEDFFFELDSLAGETNVALGAQSVAIGNEEEGLVAQQESEGVGRA